MLLRAVLLGVLLAALGALPARAEESTIAVAANFLKPLRLLESAFEATTDYRIEITSGSTGQLYAQIVNGAPFDVLLAADRERPRLLAENGLGEPSSRFTYAIGRLALWSREPGRVNEKTLNDLPDEDFRWFAIAAPDVAPYGAAAKQALERLGVWQSIEPRIVKGQNIAQTFAMIETGNADMGLVALSQALAYEGRASYAIVPAALYDPIRQDAILLHRADHNAAARAFLDFLQSPKAAQIIEQNGYTVPK